MTGFKNTGNKQGLINNVHSCLLRAAFLLFYHNKPIMNQLQFLRENEKRSSDELREIEFRLLKKSLCEANQNIPFYKKWFDDADF